MSFPLRQSSRRLIQKPLSEQSMKSIVNKLLQRVKELEKRQVTDDEKAALTDSILNYLLDKERAREEAEEKATGDTCNLSEIMKEVGKYYSQNKSFDQERIWNDVSRILDRKDCGELEWRQWHNFITELVDKWGRFWEMKTWVDANWPPERAMEMIRKLGEARNRGYYLHNGRSIDQARFIFTNVLTGKIADESWAKNSIRERIEDLVNFTGKDREQNDPPATGSQRDSTPNLNFTSDPGLTSPTSSDDSNASAQGFTSPTPSDDSNASSLMTAREFMSPTTSDNNLNASSSMTTQEFTSPTISDEDKWVALYKETLESPTSNHPLPLGLGHNTNPKYTPGQEMDPSKLSAVLLRQELRSKLGEDVKLPRKKKELIEIYKRNLRGNRPLGLGLGHNTNPKYTPGEDMDPFKLSGNVLQSKLRSKLGKDVELPRNKNELAELYERTLRENPTSDESNADLSMTTRNHPLGLGSGHNTNPKYTPGEDMDPSKLSGVGLQSKLRSKLGKDVQLPRDKDQLIKLYKRTLRERKNI